MAGRDRVRVAISRMSSGSRREESAVDPTRSQNITVNHRQLAVLGVGSRRRPALDLSDGRRRRGTDRQPIHRVEQEAAVADRGYPQILQIPGRQAPQHIATDVVLAKR